MRSTPEIPHKLDRIRTQLEGVDGNTDDIEQKLDSVISELQDIEVDVENVDINTDELEAKLDSTISELQDIESDTEANTSELQDINIELDSIDSNTDNVETLLNNTISELQDIEADVESVDANTDTLESELQDVNAELDRIDANTDEVEVKLDSAISELQDIEADTEANTAQLQDVNTELDSIDALLDELEDSLETVGTDEIRTTIYGDQPDGDRVPRLADGVAFESDAELNAGETYESPWIDTDQYKSLEIFISSDVTSAPSGIQVQFTEDAQAATPNVRGEINKTFDNAAVSRGFLLFNFPPRLDGYRVRYTNGDTDTSSFFISSIVRNRRSEPAGAPVTSEIEPKQSVQLSRSIIAGQDIDDNSKNVRVLDIDNTFPNLNGEQISLFTYLSRALQNSISLDQLRVDVENNNAGMATETTLSTISNDVDEVEVKLDTVISELQDIEADLEAQRDSAFVTSEIVSANGTIERELSAIGASKLDGHFVSTGEMSMKAQWLDGVGGTVIREQRLVNSSIPNDWQTFKLESLSPFIKIILEDRSGAEQTVNASYHYN